ncbi:response regulator transcription factor [Arthrobacter nitrophenolicus]|uniref:Response regulator transcription factor n=1 Tax=Arthrobacter nitrophenolicus TaxID=683150 RepID=A0A4R5Y797_9MICC|nr:response regulator transcription factor [Arthrobacter nitrophenolicus]TDL39646.1 response regulator transcription factor [Arthrobacter nitrophenolicus]
MRIGVVEDDDGVASALVDALEANRINAYRMSRGAEVLTRHPDFDLVLLDLGLPDMDGIDVLRHLRQVSAVPVIILTARDDERSVVRGLRNGADDYLVKPARIVELLARIEAIRRRAHRASAASTSMREFGDVIIDLTARSVQVAGTTIALTTKEFQLLEMLVDNPGTAVSRQQMMDQIWGDAFITVSRSLDVHMTALRSKLGRPGLIETIRGFGYRWTGEP